MVYIADPIQLHHRSEGFPKVGFGGPLFDQLTVPGSFLFRSLAQTVSACHKHRCTLHSPDPAHRQKGPKFLKKSMGKLPWPRCFHLSAMGGYGKASGKGGKGPKGGKGKGKAGQIHANKKRSWKRCCQGKAEWEDVAPPMKGRVLMGPDFLTVELFFFERAGTPRSTLDIIYMLYTG